MIVNDVTVKFLGANPEVCREDHSRGDQERLVNSTKKSAGSLRTGREQPQVTLAAGTAMAAGAAGTSAGSEGRRSKTTEKFIKGKQ